MRFLSLFAGVGGFDLGLERSGHECVGQVENDPACQRVLAERWSQVARWADIRDVRFQPDGRKSERGLRLVMPVSESGVGSRYSVGASYLDLLVGGFPCQDLSVAGKRAGLGAARSGLFWEIVRIAKAIRPTWGLFENVPGLLSSNDGRDFWAVLSGLRECWPAVGYRILDSQYVGGCELHGRTGVPQRRRRVFIVCGPTERSVAAVLFEPEGRGWNPATGEEAGTGVAGPLGGGAYGTGRATEDDPNLIVACLDGAPHADREAEHSRLIVQQAMSSKWSKGSSGPAGDEHHNLVVTHPLKAEGADASEDGTGRGVPMVWALGSHSGAAEGDQTNRSHKSGGPVGMGVSEELAYSLREGRTQSVAGVGVAGPIRSNPRNNSNPTTEAGELMARGAVRRLTPTECERLQGFPDGWTDIPGSSDSTRYRQLGNAVTVSVATWLGKRLKEATP